ncbi:MAG TPA: serine/threonine-protein kinase, partial [Vicinamibacterales bacterium]|nr:serine/threonine-protein kinase [Vicinamibacterales bacterium]
MVGQHISKYRVTEQIGRGGMGTVYRAIDETLHREVAIKVLNTELNDPTVARRFRAEAVTVARLNHPGIATIYELLQHEGQWLMVMEFVRGETLERLCSRKGSLPVDQAADLCMQTLSALAHAHSLGVVHRDLKPANLMVTDGGSIKIMDFGIARVAGTEHLTSAGFMMGTPAYMAPEQVLGQEIDARTDLYATGVVLYHLTTGRLPFKGDTPLEMAQSRINDTPTPARSVREDLPAWLAQVLDISLTRAPERRFQTALLFREALRRGLANLPIETPAPAAPPPELIATAAPRSLPIATAEPLPVAAQ